MDIDGDLQIGAYNPNNFSQSNKTKLKHDVATQRAQISENGGAFSLLTRKTLDELDDVTITAPTNNQVLKYNSGAGVW